MLVLRWLFKLLCEIGHLSVGLFYSIGDGNAQSKSPSVNIVFLFLILSKIQKKQRRKDGY